MNVMKCSACGKPIVGYWVTIKKMGDNRNFCVPCAQSTSIWDLVVEGVFGIQPDIAVEIDGDKQRLSSAYGMFADEEDENKPRLDSECDLFADENNADEDTDSATTESTKDDA